ncbi:hypothetical protein [uncultured Oscillibacter sp.]|uniref:hypothetical protein n=1 Tax=uncultured Oscillibacter sp. TaxID=876091 RepID=UPI002639ED2F|nr:hypothetical protein [uncultured Oscillibacter sp.]
MCRFPAVKKKYCLGEIPGSIFAFFDIFAFFAHFAPFDFFAGIFDGRRFSNGPACLPEAQHHWENGRAQRPATGVMTGGGRKSRSLRRPRVEKGEKF